MKKLLIALTLLFLSISVPAQAQNPQCPTRPLGDNTNACASTTFVQVAASPQTILNTLCTTSGAFPIYNATSGAWVCSTVGGTGSLGQLNGGPFSVNTGAAGQKAALQTLQALTGAFTGTFSANFFGIASDDMAATQGRIGWGFSDTFGGSAMHGNRISLSLASVFTAADNNDAAFQPPGGPYYISFFPSMAVNASNHGTNPSAGARGAYQVMNPVLTASAAASNLYVMTVQENNIGMLAGSSVKIKTALLLAALGTDAVQGTDSDALLQLSSGGGAIGWKSVIEIGPVSGGLPYNSSSVLFNVVSAGGTAAKGISLTGATITGNAFESNKFAVTGAGVGQIKSLALGTAGTDKGTFSVSGNTSGTITFQPQDAAGTYNVNWPTSAGTAGQPLLSGGGGSAAMTYGTVTGSGNFVLSASPTFTGTVAGAAATWTGNSSAAAFIPTGSTVPTNGMYLPSANAVAFATNSTLAMTIASNQKIGIGQAPGVSVVTIAAGAGVDPFAVSNADASSFAQIIISASARSYQFGVGGASAALGVANKFFIFKATATAGMVMIMDETTAAFQQTTASTSATTGSVTAAGGMGIAGAIWAGTYVATGVVAVASLPACGAGIKGARMFVNDNNTALAFAAVITTGGAIQTPVYCDGTVWRQGANDNIPAHLMRKFA